MRDMALLEVEALTVVYGKEHALSDVSFQLEHGTVLGVIGADGAGKTSLLRTVIGLVKPAAGHVSIHNGTGIGYVPQQFSLYGDMTLEENLSFFGSLNGLSGRTLQNRMAELLDFTGLTPFRQRMADALSGGMKQKLSLAVCLIHHPECVILDEPTNGVDPVARRELWELIGEVRKEGVGVLVSTQYLDEAEQCDHVLLLHHGHIIQFGSPEQMCDAFQYRLWVLPESGQQRMEVETLSGKPGIRHVYAKGNDTVLVIENEEEAHRSLREWEQGIGVFFTVEERKPSVEDVFISFVEAEEEVDR